MSSRRAGSGEGSARLTKEVALHTQTNKHAARQVSKRSRIRAYEISSRASRVWATVSSVGRELDHRERPRPFAGDRPIHPRSA